MLPDNFVFSQSSLQDFVDCQRRFQLRYVERQAWPAVQTEPLVEHERHIARGARFHRLVERHQLGMSPDMLERMIDDPDLRSWWESYLSFGEVHGLEGTRYPEYTLAAEVVGVRLMATYDLLVITPGGQVVVVDWKTYRKMPGRAWFQTRLQTRVYPFVVVLMGLAQPEHVSMIYWVSGKSITFGYDAAQYELDRAYLVSLVDSVRALPSSLEWAKTSDEIRCRFCVYRSLCDRGEVAGTAVDSVFGGVDSVDSLVGFDSVDELGF